MQEPQVHWVRIQYDPDQDHFQVDGAYKFTPRKFTVDGYAANTKLQMYLEAFFHEAEVLRRNARDNKNEKLTLPTNPPPP